MLWLRSCCLLQEAAAKLKAQLSKAREEAERVSGTRAVVGQASCSGGNV